MAGQSAAAYGQAGAVAEESLTSMRTVAAFNAEPLELARFEQKLEITRIAGEKRSKANGVMFGSFLFIMFSSYGLAFWFGAELIIKQTTNARTGLPYTGGDILSTFFAILIGSFSLGQLAPYLPDFTNGRAAGFRVLQIIDRVPSIGQGEGKCPKKLGGDIAFQNVKFSYPTRPDVPILQRVTFEIKAGQTVALVGESGSGKSTCIGLLERFYDPVEGSIVIDGEHRLDDLSVNWWRKNVGLVSQMPILFQGTIAENIMYGKGDASMEEIIDAAKKANAHDFIADLPDQYDTMVGGFGSEFLSGGQKQRIAIARALIKQPKILLLDEATSALDNESEKVVQKALDDLISGETGKHLTCLIIAHRLSTIKHADMILVFSRGEIVERGTHEELMALNGTYYNLIQSQDAVNHGDEKQESGMGNQTRAPPFSHLALPQTHIRAEPSKSNHSRSQRLALGVPVPEDGVGLVATADEPEDLFEEDKESQQEHDVKVPLSYLWELVRPNFVFAFLGIAASIGAGAVQPIFGLVLSNMISIFYTTNMAKLKHDAAKYASYFVIVAGCQFCFMLFQNTGLGVVGERITKRLRFDVFRSLLRQEISFYDDPKNASGVLATRLGVDSEQVRKITTDWTGMLLQVAVCALGGLLIAYLTNWRMAFLLTAFCPFIVLSGLGHMIFMKAKGGKKEFEEAGRLASEAISGVHTIVSFNAESAVLSKFSNILLIPLRAGIRVGVITGMALGGSEMSLFFAYAGSLCFGAYLIDRNLATFTEVTRVFFCVVLSFQNVGRVSERMPDIKKATAGMRAVYSLIIRKSSINHEDEGGEIVDPSQSSIVLKEVKFRYPSRPDVMVLRDLSLEINPGKTVALVGFSGSGKSTVIQLLERYYDPEAGFIDVDGRNLANLNLKSWRSNIGYVGQEPVLFNMTIKENIKYGKPDATDEEVLEVARMANVMEFAEKLSAGLDTSVGSRGGQLSGGQRQRVAIARALIRDPSILLLDEATSALDNESERLIQEALDRLTRHRTVVVVAHRLSTIQRADKIVVMSGGQVVESGTHEDLALIEDGYRESPLLAL
eukprot:TRINITY_DN4448_c0_g1_i1.p1 TRINITY_DN4448_c0_g1~~TRINITY_DN4448_c0_g1_i1.p1  ORF type:complete len:1075 (-),score=270.04 TRINITY_DN4448_c0_g1_i1:354-3551(-)